MPDPGQLPHRPLERGGLSERSGHVGRPARGGPQDQGEVRQPGRASGSRRKWTRTWRARPALVLRRGRAGRERQRRPELEGNGRGPRVRAGALQGGETPEVFTWDPSSNNRMMLAGRASFVQNAISVTRTAEKENPEIARKIGLVPALRGPVRRIAAEHVMNCYVIWKFAEEHRGGEAVPRRPRRQLRGGLPESEFYNFPCYPPTVPDLAELLANDPKADPPGKYSALAGGPRLGDERRVTRGTRPPRSTRCSTRSSLPTMFARVARDEIPRRPRRRRRRRTGADLREVEVKGPSPGPSPAGRGNPRSATLTPSPPGGGRGWVRGASSKIAPGALQRARAGAGDD